MLALFMKLQGNVLTLNIHRRHIQLTSCQKKKKSGLSQI